MNGLNPRYCRRKAARGGYKTAFKMGRDWVIDKNEKNVDLRVKSGKYKNWRNRK
jgi:hypothetical protein